MMHNVVNEKLSPAAPEPNPAGADPLVAAALALISQTGSAPPGGQAPPDATTVRITATASGPANSRATRVAIVRIGATLPHGYAVLAWGAGVD